MVGNKIAQMWVTDLSISIMIFTVAALVAFGILMNVFSEQEEFNTVRTDAVRISEYMMGDGTPAGWNETNFIRLGFMSNGKINSSKVSLAMNLSNSTYVAIKSGYQTDFDFAIVLENRSGQIIPFMGYCAFGKQNSIWSYQNTTGGCVPANFTLLDYDDLVKINRIAVYGSEIIKITVYVWR